MISGNLIPIRWCSNWTLECITSHGKEKILNVGLVIDHSGIVTGEETLSLNGKAVGVINSPCYSHRMAKSLALGHVNPSVASEGPLLEVSGSGIDTTATMANLPFYDPQKTRTHA